MKNKLYMLAIIAMFTSGSVFCWQQIYSVEDAVMTEVQCNGLCDEERMDIEYEPMDLDDEESVSIDVMDIE